jgi:hypothetical protein
LVGPLFLSQLAARLHRTVVERLEDLLVQQRRFRARKTKIGRIWKAAIK